MGYIKEVEPLEFTKSDMSEFAQFSLKKHYGNQFYHLDEDMETWLKQKNK